MKTTKTAKKRLDAEAEADAMRYRIFETAMGWTWFAVRGERIVKIELPQTTRALAAASVKRFDPTAEEDRTLCEKVVKE